MMRPLKILLLNQAFYPDPVATGQQLADLAFELAARGHRVTAVAGRHGYDDPARVYPARESVRGVDIRRISYSSRGKGSKLSRAADFASFHAGLLAALCVLPRQDVAVGLTSPPLLSVTANLLGGLKHCHFIHWVMDLNPDEAVAAGWLRRGSMAERMLAGLSAWAFRRGEWILALDRFMKERLVSRYGIPEGKVRILPPWSHDDHIRPIEHTNNPFRAERGLEGKFVVMYSGNHSPCHPLDTVLDAARRMSGDPSVVFCFIGGGSEVEKVRRFREEHGLKSILQLPYQPLERLSESLSAADLHLVVMGDAFTGILHPSKIYGILAAGRPFVFIGPEESHLGDLMRETGLGQRVGHGDAEGLERAIRRAQAAGPEERRRVSSESVRVKDERFSRMKLCVRLADWVEQTGSRPASAETH